MQEEFTLKILNKIKENEESKEFIKDYMIIDNMIANYPKDNNLYLIESIKNKYRYEINMLANLEQIINKRKAVSLNNHSFLDYLISVRHSMIRIGVLKFIECNLKERLGDCIVTPDDRILYETICLFEKH